MYCATTKSSGKLCLHRKTSLSLSSNDHQYLQCASVFQVRIISFEDQTNSLFLSFGPGLYIFEENPKSFQDVIGDVCCPGNYCFNREKCEFLDSYVRTPRSVYGCGKCEVWLFFSQSFFNVTGARKDDKNRQSTLFC